MTVPQTMQAMIQSKDLKLQGQKSLSDPPSDSTHSLEKVDEAAEDKQEIPKLQIQLSADSSPCEEECLRSMENLQEEVKNVYELFEEYSVIIKEQKEKVNEVENNVEESAINVEEGACNLVRAANYKATMYPIAGAVLGGCLGGPIGLIAGFKLGGLAAVGCGVIGFTGGQLLKKKHRIIADERGVELVEVNHSILPSSQISAVVPDGSRSTSVPTVKKIL
ncbi:hypothetical protein C0J52_26361 [Blattella germanica]|nr:hypothetical protein C0J52_26361 [Blattella germanica]